MLFRSTLFDGHDFRDEHLEVDDRRHPPIVGIVVQMSAPAGGELLEPRGSEPGPLVHDERRRVSVQDLEQAVDDLEEIEGLEPEQAAELIMTARAHWFESEQEA